MRRSTAGRGGVGGRAVRRRGSAAAASLLAGALLVGAPVTASAAGGADLDLDVGRAAASAAELSDGAVLRDASGDTAVLRTTVRPAPEVTARVVDGVEALRLARGCSSSSLWSCPRAVVEVSGSEDLDPGSGDFTVAATLLLQPWQASGGSNVLQKGWNRGGGGQYKLQVDGRAGIPSCVVVGTGTSRTYRVLARSSVADGAWHEVGCRRAGDRLQVLVDGEVERSTWVPTWLSIDNDQVVRLGAKGLGGYDVDQYRGQIGRVLIDVDA